MAHEELLRRIDSRLTDLGLSERKACLNAGLSVDAIRTIRRGNAPKVPTLEKLAISLGVPADYLIDAIRSSDGPGLLARQAPGILTFGANEYTAVAQFDLSLSAGPGSMLDPSPQPLGYHLIETQWLRALTRAAPEHLAVVRVAGDSMEPTLNDGDWILVDLTQKRVSREGIYALHVYEDAWVKRMSLNLHDRTIRIISDNGRYPVQELPEDDVTLIGRAICVVARKL